MGAKTSKTSKTDVKGVCHPAFAPLREAFAEDFASGRSIGASVALYVRSCRSTSAALPDS
eukprot:SAG22_NODE_1529_length_4218_cov_2.153435_5_plen_60_part_00